MSRPRKVPLPQNTRISCICIVRTARMMLHGVEIGTLSEESNDAGEFDWVRRPNWENIDCRSQG